MSERSPARYDVSVLSDSDRDEALALMRLALGETSAAAKTEANWRWKHEANPFGRSLVLGARDESGQLASLRVLLRWTFTAPDGQAVHAVRPVDTATHPDHRRRGLFKSLTLQAIAEVDREGGAFLFNTPNHNSLPGYLGMGWTVVARWPLYARPTSQLLRRVLRLRALERAATPWRAFLKEHAGPVERLVARHEAGRAPVGYRTPRTLAFLEWRYADLPGLHYEVVPQWTGGELTGLAIGRMTSGFRGLPAFVLTEAFCTDPEPSAMGTLFRRVVHDTRAHYVLAHFATASVEYRGLRSARFVRLPGRGYTFVSRRLHAATSPDPALRDSWDLTIGELELF